MALPDDSDRTMWITIDRNQTAARLASMSGGAVIAEFFRPVVAGGVQIKPMNVDEYHQLIESGELPQSTSVELIHGYLVFKDRSAAGEDPMTIGDQHRVSTLKTMRLAPQVEAAGAFMQSQQNVTFRPSHEPEPDITIVSGKIEDFLDHAPGAADVICIFEVADSSLRNDRTVKLEVYAQVGIRQYVIINLPDHLVEFYTQPTKAGRYRKKQVLRSTETLRLQLGKQRTLSVAVRDLLP